ncbi:MAG: DNA-formamidopyrimidine glycosylase family protein [Owenweeksia sp.]|nr:DNA-formamidopyrimidine glycosylase family protein [Owenweeksia sp.]
MNAIKFSKAAVRKLRQKLIGCKFTTTDRFGKYFFAKLSNGHWLHLHFGLTGNLELFTDQSTKPQYTRFIIMFKNGEFIAFRDLRKFGIVQLVSDPESYRIEHNLGPDLLKTTEDEFLNALRGRKTAVKNALLDQKNFTGIGNWIADEMLFETGIHPETHPAKLSDQQLKELYQAAVKVVRQAIEADTHYGSFPAHFFANFRKKDAIHPSHKTSPIKALKVGGRGSYIVPEKQIKIE